jgi:hypothetical protein
MDVELNQFQIDLLESVREMSKSYAIRASEVRLLQMRESVIAYVPSLELDHANASLELKSSDA